MRAAYEKHDDKNRVHPSRAAQVKIRLKYMLVPEQPQATASRAEADGSD